LSDEPLGSHKKQLLQMKKLVFSALSLLLVASTYSLAKRSIRGEFSSVSYHQGELMKIKKEELPEAARKTLEGDAFKGWSVASSYKTRSGEYEVELKKGDSMQTIKFDKDGKVK
jgi:hypothetical protein